MSKRALIFANGQLYEGPAVAQAMQHAGESLIIAADGGARLATNCGQVPDLVVGDLDSLSGLEIDQLHRQGAQIQRSSPHKDETDLELALLAAVQREAAWIRVLGAYGDRLDQTLANVYLLALPALQGRDVALAVGRQTSWLLRPGEHALPGDPGDTLSLLPLGGDAGGITTQGLHYALQNETLRFGPARGVSNVIQAAGARLSFSDGLLLIVHTPGRA